MRWENNNEQKVRLWMSYVFMNETTYVSMSHPIVLRIIKGENDQNNRQKVIQFASIQLNVTYYMKTNDQRHEDFKPLFEFLKLKNNPNKYWNDTLGQKIVYHVHNQFLITTKFEIQGSESMALTCDEVISNYCLG